MSFLLAFAMQAVSLRDNQFTGNITQFALCSLQSLDLSDNQFTGPLPAPLARGPLADGQFSRPPWLRLMSISLANNQLTGTLPEFAYGSVSIEDCAGAQPRLEARKLCAAQQHDHPSLTPCLWASASSSSLSSACATLGMCSTRVLLVTVQVDGCLHLVLVSAQ